MGTAVLVAGLGYGDEGKGTIVDYLCAKRDVELVVRYNGGAQAAHNVVTPAGMHHTFAQIGSGFFQGAKTLLSKHVLVDLFALVKEAEHLVDEHWYENPLRSVYVDKRAVLITPYHRVANRIREQLRGDGRHGSCGMGVGEARKDELENLALRFGDLEYPQVTIYKLRAIQDKKQTELGRENIGEEYLEDLSIDPEWVAKAFKDLYGVVRPPPSGLLETALKKTVVFEGAQGVLLDEDYGFYPYNTWTNTRFDNAMEVLDEVGFNGIIEKCGVTRQYMTRHGAGPFVTEQKDWNANLGEHNKEGPWQGCLRSGNLDLIALRYAVEVCKGVDYLAMTHMDHRTQDICIGYQDYSTDFFTGGNSREPGGHILAVKREPAEMEKLTKSLFSTKPVLMGFSLHYIEMMLGAKIRIQSTGPTCRDKKEV